MANSLNKVNFNLAWRYIGNAPLAGVPSLMVLDGCSISSKSIVYGFDLDGTLITTASGSKIPKGYRDWKFRYPQIVSKVKELHQQNVKVAIFTNQAGISLGYINTSGIGRKMEAIVRALGVPIQVFVSTCYDHCRKPAPGMWEYMETHCNNGVQVNRSQSLFIGDAAGRMGDHADSDKAFANNLKIAFKTPEEFWGDN